ncbi:MAG: pre-peptidase C-terminal domain-containing protein [Deltaproteobacteria bacterium]|nr:pre-peptidase C-terminal domain-containing protein [Deltaproteobacteria bacterium]
METDTTILNETDPGWGTADSSIDAPCKENSTSCSGDILRLCLDGDWKDWDDCSVHSAMCTVVSGVHQCVVIRDTSKLLDTDTSDDTGTQTDAQDTSDTEVDSNTHLPDDTGTQTDAQDTSDTGVDSSTHLPDDTGTQTDAQDTSDTGADSETETVIDSDSVIDTGKQTAVDTGSGSDSVVDTGTGTGQSSVTALTIVAPNGGESWKVGTTHDITWTYSGDVTNVKLEYTYDDGDHWRGITASTLNDGAYAWAIPEKTASSSEVRVRISDASDLLPNDVSDALLSLLPVDDDAFEPNDDYVAAYPIVFGDSVGAKLIYDSIIDYYKFDATAGDAIVITNLTYSLSESIYEFDVGIMDGDLNWVAGMPFSDNNTEYLSFIAPRTGTYFIAVHSSYGLGEYLFTLTKGQ